jgi:hypothetical protein
MTVLRSTNAALCLCFMVRLPNLNWLLYTYLIDRQDVFFDYTFRQTLLAVRRKNYDSQAGEKDNIVKIKWSEL